MLQFSLKNKEMINNNNTLLIAPMFFGYYKEIQREIMNYGFEVDYLPDAPSNTNISKALGRINKRLIQNSAKKYFEQTVLPIISDKEYRYVFIIGGMTFAFTNAMISTMRKYCSNTTFVLYLWDSKKNLPYVQQIEHHFDKIYSFDRNDCMDNSKYKFLPLFYIRKYEEIGMINKPCFSYDCCYIGTAHPQKYQYINKMSSLLECIYPKQFIYHYMPSVLKYIYHKILAPEYKHAKFKEFRHEKMSTEEVVAIISKSRCVLDAPQAGQTGLTIRSIECLGARRKLITTNTDIVNYDFYKPQNVFVVNSFDEIDFNDIFFNSDYSDIDESCYYKYSLREWVRTIIDMDEDYQ